jgi:hypothetical protein
VLALSEEKTVTFKISGKKKIKFYTNFSTLEYVVICGIVPLGYRTPYGPQKYLFYAQRCFLTRKENVTDLEGVICRSLH